MSGKRLPGKNYNPSKHVELDSHTSPQAEHQRRTTETLRDLFKSLKAEYCSEYVCEETPNTGKRITIQKQSEQFCYYNLKIHQAENTILKILP